jgi:hypothetical protein
LSFKGLSFNLAYGLIGVLYSVLLAFLRPRTAAIMPGLSSLELENAVFVGSMGWFPGYFAVTIVILIFVARWQLRHTDDHKRLG